MNNLKTLIQRIRPSVWIALGVIAILLPVALFRLIYTSQAALPESTAYWAFNEGYGTTTEDSSGNGHTAIINGASWQTEDMCVSEKCLYFDGIDNNVTVSNTVSGVRTVTFWVRSMDNTGPLVDLDGTSIVELDTSTVLATEFTSPTIYVNAAETDTLVPNRWQHVAVVTSTGITADDIKIATDGTGHTTAFFDEVKFYDVALTAAQIKADFTARGGGPTAARFGPDTKFLSDGLVGYWKMDEDSGNVADSSGNGVTLTNNGTTPFNAGRFGNAATFNGSSRYFSAGSTLSEVQTIAFWVNPANTTDNFIHLASGLYINSSTGTISATGVSDPTIYVNGVQSNSISTSSWQHVAITTSSALSASAFEVGRADDSYAANNSQIDEVRLYNRAFTSSEVRKLYEWAPGPVAYWKFDEQHPPMPEGGMFVYVEGQSAGSNIQYRIMDGDGNWKASAATTISTSTLASSDHAPLSIKVFASKTRDEYIVVANFEDHNSPFENIIAAMVYDGKNGTWGNEQILRENIAEPTVNQRYLFDGTYLDASGNFMVVHSNQAGSSGDDTPRFSIWNGDTWSTVDAPTASINANPAHIVTKNRPGTDEVMIAMVDSYGTDPRTISTLYYDGLGTSTTNFTHTTNAPHTAIWHNSNPIVDFVWDANDPNRGWLTYLDRNISHTNPAVNVFTADGMGGGSWGTATAAVGLASNYPGAIVATARPENNDLLFCASNVESFDDLSCFVENDNDTTPTTKTTTNGQMTATPVEDGGVRGFGVAYESQNPNRAIAIYSDNTSTPKLKKFDPTAGTNGTWDSSPTSLSSIQSVPKLILVRPDPYSNDMAILLRSGNTPTAGPGYLYTVFWDGENGELYSSGDRAQTLHHSSSAPYSQSRSGDFAWKRYGTQPEDYLAYDHSTNEHHGFVKSATWVPGKFGSALSFHGADNYINVGTGPSQVNTVSFWVNPVSTTEHFIDLNGTAYIWANNGTVIATGFSSPTIYVNGVQTTSISADSWQHVSITTATPINASALDLGRVDGEGYLEGRLDDVRFYNYVRSPGQVIEDMNAGHPLGGSPVGSQVAHWKFDEGYGTTARDSIGLHSGMDGTFSGGVSWLQSNDCRVNRCLEFNGSDGYVDITDNSALSPTEEITISFWAKQSSLAGNKTMIAKWTWQSQASWAILTDSLDDTQLRIFVPDSLTDDGSNFARTPTGSWTADTWNHVAVTYNGSGSGNAGKLQVYINGVQQNLNFTGTIPSSLQNSTAPVRIGSFQNLGRYWNGQIDEVKIYSAALSPSQVLVDYNQGAIMGASVGANEADTLVDGAFPNPVGYWSFNENQGTDVFDRSSNSNNGSWSGSGTARWVPGKYGSSGNFNGTNDTVNIGNVAQLDFERTDAFSASFWMKTIEDSGMTPISKQESSGNFRGWNIQTGFGGLIYFQLVNVYSSNTLEVRTTNDIGYYDGAWNHVVATYDGSSGPSGVKIYFNGNLEPSYATIDTLSATIVSSASAHIGTRNGAANFFDGQLDEIKVWDSVLSPVQVAYEYNRGRPIAHWKADEALWDGTSGEIKDSSGNGYHGVRGGSATTIADGKFGRAGTFNGSTDFANVYSAGLASHFSGDLGTVTAWGRITDQDVWTDGATRAILQFGVDSNNRVRFYKRSSTDAIQSEYIAGGTNRNADCPNQGSNWFFIAMAWDASEDKVWHYCNGELVSASTGLGTWSGALDSTRAVFGSLQTTSSSTRWAGDVDDVRVYNYPLSPTQIRQVMNEGAGVRFGP